MNIPRKTISLMAELLVKAELCSRFALAEHFDEIVEAMSADSVCSGEEVQRLLVNGMLAGVEQNYAVKNVDDTWSQLLS